MCFPKHKYEVFEAFKIWKVTVENEVGLKNKILITNNNDEYKDNIFMLTK